MRPWSLGKRDPWMPQGRKEAFLHLLSSFPVTGHSVTGSLATPPLFICGFQPTRPLSEVQLLPVGDLLCVTHLILLPLHNGEC